MKSIPQAARGQRIPAPPRRETVFMGRLDFLSVLIRQMGVELYKIRRRTMSRVLSTVIIFIMLVVFAVIAAGAFIERSSPASNFLLPPCSTAQGQTQDCLDHTPTPAEAAQAKQAALDDATAPLRLPGSLGTAVQTVQAVGLILIIILAGTIVGGEYSVGTIRMMLTRGPTRTQFLLAKIGAILACLVLGAVVVILLGIVEGTLLTLAVGMGVSTGFLTAMWIVHAVLYVCAAILGLFMYAMLALCLSTLGRATAAGVAGAIVWWVLENALGDILVLLGTLVKGPLGAALKATPDYFITNNVNALVQNQGQYILNRAPAQLSDLHAVLVLAGYLILFIGLAWWVTQRRDITN